MKSNKKGMKLSKEERAKVVNCCNRGLITDDNYTPDEMFPMSGFSLYLTLSMMKKSRNNWEKLFIKRVLPIS